jgi:bla regulator protein BlaR1
MILYLIKSGLCLAMVLGTYLLLFEDKKMHLFNRWFLLLGLFFSFIVPVVETEIAIDIFNFTSASEPTSQIIEATGEILFLSPEESNIKEETISISQISTIGYLLISALLLIRFCFNITILLRKSFYNKQVTYKGAILVLLKEQVLPHTFGKYIFINKSDYQNQQIEAALFTHELTHARQWHSLDVILIEFLQVLFWYNPFLIPYKRAMQLNHEFLADEQVIKSHRRVRDYQELLLDKATLSKVYLASNLNFSVTKKRLTMMTKSTSRRKNFLFASATLPLFACLLMLFSCSKTNAQQLKEVSEQDKEEYLKNATIVRENKEGQKIYKPYADMTAAEKAKIPPPPPNPLAEKLEPLPEGTLIEIEADGKVLLRNNKGALAPPHPPHPPKAPKELKAPKAPKGVHRINNNTPPTAPTVKVPRPPVAPPPPPPNPIEHIKELASKDGGATFYLAGKEITGNKAVELLEQKEDGYNISVKKGRGDSVMVYLKEAI